MSSTLKERAVLMQLSIGLPGESRQDPKLSSEVKVEHQLGSEAGHWIKELLPKEALQEVKSLDNEARAVHAFMAFPFEKAIRILPAGLIAEHGDKMREFRGRRDVLVEKFLADPVKWVVWAQSQHNGTFDPKQHPGCVKIENGVVPDGFEVVGEYALDVAKWRAAMRKKFYFETCPLPVPEGGHFSETIATLLGTDVSATDRRVAQAEATARQELLEKLLGPVMAMAQKLAEEPKRKKDGTIAKDIVFRDSLVGNLREIARLAPAMNLSDDAGMQAFIREVEKLSAVDPDTLRDNKAVRSEVQKQADELSKRLAAYSF